MSRGHRLPGFGFYGGPFRLSCTSLEALGMGPTRALPYYLQGTPSELQFYSTPHAQGRRNPSQPPKPSLPAGTGLSMGGDLRVVPSAFFSLREGMGPAVAHLCSCPQMEWRVSNDTSAKGNLHRFLASSPPSDGLPTSTLHSLSYFPHPSVQRRHRWHHCHCCHCHSSPLFFFL